MCICVALFQDHAPSSYIPVIHRRHIYTRSRGKTNSFYALFVCGLRPTRQSVYHVCLKQKECEYGLKLSIASMLSLTTNAILDDAWLSKREEEMGVRR